MTMRSLLSEDVVPGAIATYSHDLTALAEQGQFEPLHGHEKEVARVLQVLARLRKYNPMLLGEDSAERFAIVAEVARRISNGNVPEGVKVKRVVALDFEALLAAAQTADDYQKLLQAILAELACSEGHILLFIDNMQMLLSGRWTKGNVDAARDIRIALARGEIVVLGTMTSEDFETYLGRSAALWRRCQEILVRAARE